MHSFRKVKHYLGIFSLELHFRETLNKYENGFLLVTRGPKETLYSFVYCYGDTMKRGTTGVAYQTKHRQYTLHVSHLIKAKKQSFYYSSTLIESLPSF